MTTRLLLLRHAAHDLAGRALAGRMAGLGLNGRGQRQAQALAAALRAHEPAILYSSPQQRTRETAEPIGRALGIDVGIAPEFDEIDFGEWTGRDFADLSGPQWEEWNARRSIATPPGGEPFRSACERAMQGVQRLRGAHPDSVVLVVSHADVIKAVVATTLGMSLDDLERFEVTCASLTLLDVGDGWSRLAGLNLPLVAS